MEARPALAPKLRFPEFRDADGWEQTTLGAVARLKNGYAFKSADYVDSGQFQIITIANVQQGSLALEAAKRIAQPPADIQTHQKLRIGDILISMTGNVGRVCRVTCDSLLLNQRVGKLIPEEIAPEFLYHSLQRDEFRNAMQLKAAGGAQGNLSGGDITDYPLHRPADDAEQQKIAECLSSVDELMAAQARKVDALKTHKKGLMQQLFPREGETQPRLRFPEFQNAGEWDPTSLGGVARLRNGYAFKSAEYVDDGPYQIITIANVQQGSLTIESTKRMAALPSDIQQHQVLILGDILISMTGNVGRVCRVTAEGCFSINVWGSWFQRKSTLLSSTNCYSATSSGTPCS
jgi:type I restriction enzyme S subunit